MLSSPIHLAHFCSVVNPLPHRYRTAIVPLSLRCRSAVAPISLHCRSAAEAVAPLLLQCRSAAVDPDVATQSLLILPPLSLRCRTTVAPLSLRYHSDVAPLSLFCCFAVASVAPLPIMLLLLSQRYHFCYRSCCRSRSSPQ